jgi:hypothetical protein
VFSVRRVVLLLLACAAVPAVALAGRNPHAEKRHHTRADMALARQVLLRQSDVGPDWIRVAVPRNDSTLDCPGFDPDFSRFTITGESQALYSFRSLDQILSSSEVYRSRAEAIHDFQLGARPELAGCLRHTLVRTLRASAPGLTIARASARAARAPKLGERAAAYHLAATVAANGVQLHVYMDLLVFQRGRTQAGLIFTGIGSPVPSQASYARVVAARMR